MQKLKTVYGHLRKDYLEAQPYCEARLVGCTFQATDIHHMAGRGERMNDVSTFKAVCRNCHNWIEEHPREAKERGLSVSRLAS